MMQQSAFSAVPCSPEEPLLVTVCVSPGAVTDLDTPALSGRSVMLRKTQVMALPWLCFLPAPLQGLSWLQPRSQVRDKGLSKALRLQGRITLYSQKV